MDTLKGQIEAQAIELKNKDTIIDKLIDEKVRVDIDKYYQANESNLKQEISDFKKQFQDLKESNNNEKVR